MTDNQTPMSDQSPGWRLMAAAAVTVLIQGQVPSWVIPSSGPFDVVIVCADRHLVGLQDLQAGTTVNLDKECQKQ